MKDIDVLSKINNTGVISIVRGISKDRILHVADALYKGGVEIIEVTFNTPDAISMIEVLRENYSDKMIIGAGTVLDAQTARNAILAGAQFILSPSLHEDVIKICNKYSILSVPGVFTPTEAITAWELGAKLIKIFPAAVLGPQYIKQLLGPLNMLEITVVGGINEGNFADFLKAGASSAGIGSELVSKDAVNKGAYEEIYKRAKCYSEIFKNIKKG